jgi:hypothetical protein
METGDGGDRVLRGNDVATVNGIENMPYILMFGGGDNNYWANKLAYDNKPQLQYLSQTENVLKEVVLNSAGRLKIEQAVLQDLEVLKKYYGAEIKVTVIIGGVNRCEIRININGKTIQAVWNPATEFLNYQLSA